MLRVLPFVLVFVVGSALGMFLAMLVKDSAPPASESTLEPGPGIATPAVAEEEEGQPTPAVASGSTPIEDDTLLARAVAAIDTVDVGDLDGGISGQVLTIDGTPVPGVEIIATARGSREDREEAESLEEKVRRYVRDQHWRETLKSETTTDDEGRYALAGIGSIEYRVNAKRPAYRFESPGRTSSRAKSGDTVDFTATPLAQLEISILRTDGTVPEKARVNVGTPRRSRGHRWTPEEPTIDVDPGLLTVSARGEEHENSEPVEVEVQMGTPVVVDLVLQARGVIRGKVVFPPEEVDGNIAVALLSGKLFPEPRPQDFVASEKTNWVSSNQQFTFGDLDPGRYWIGYGRGRNWDQQLGSMIPVDVENGPVEITIEVEGLDLAGATRVYVYDPEGRPMTDVSVSIGFQSEGRSSWGGGDSTRMRDGSVVIRPDEGMLSLLEEDPTGQLFVSAQHASYGQHRVPITSFGGTVEARFEAPAKAVVTILGYVGNDLVGRLHINLQVDQGNSYRGWGGNSNRPDEDGIVKLGPTSPGAYTLQVNYQEQRNRHWSSGVLVTQPVTLVAGENRISVSLPAVHTVEVEFPEEITNGSATLTPADQAAGARSYFHRQATITDGRVQFDAVVAGSYQLQIHANGVQTSPMFLDVPTSGVVFFEIVPPNAVIYVGVQEEGGTLALAGFADGDVIVEIEGAVYEAEEQLAMMTALLQAGGPVELRIDRAGEEFDLIFDPRVLMDGATPGGSFRPSRR